MGWSSLTAAGAIVEVPLQSSTTCHDQAPADKADVRAGREVLMQLGAASPSGSPGAGVGSRLGAAVDVTLVAP